MVFSQFTHGGQESAPKSPQGKYKPLAVIKRTLSRNDYFKKLIMKTMTCEQLGGACDKIFLANTFEEIAEMSKQHGMEMYQKKVQAHMAAMGKMQELMQKPAAMQK